MQAMYSFLEEELYTPETRFFLLQLIDSFNSNKDIDWQVESIVSKFGITRKVAVESLQHYQKSEYLHKSNLRENKKGRPKCNYVYTEKFKKIADEIKNAEIPKYVESILKELLVIDQSDNEEKKHDNLKVANRLFLCVLIANSNGYGVVNNLSANDISKLAGMSKDQIRSQRKKLKELGYISHYISGVRTSCFLGDKNSSYFININNKFPARDNEKTKHIQLEWRLILEDEYLHRCLSDKDVLKPFFKLINKYSLSSYVNFFESKLEKIACEFITHYKSRSLEDDKLEDEESKIKYIKDKLLKSLINGNSKLIKEDKEFLLDVGIEFISYLQKAHEQLCCRTPDDCKYVYQIIYIKDLKILVRYTDD